MSDNLFKHGFIHDRCEKCSASLEGGEEFVQCHDESKKYKDCGSVWCMDCYEKEDGAWYYKDEDALPSADGVLVHTDLCPKCNNVKATVDRIEAAVAAKRSQGVAPPSFYGSKGSDFSGLETFWIFLNEFHESLAEVVDGEHAETDALLTAMLERIKTKREEQ